MLPQPATRTPIDLEALAKGFDAQKGQPPSNPTLVRGC
jgi:hypothetical protein